MKTFQRGIVKRLTVHTLWINTLFFYLPTYDLFNKYQSKRDVSFKRWGNF